MERRSELIIKNRLGLHLRAAAQFVKVAARFPCDVLVEHGPLSVNGKSIMGLATLAAARGTQIVITTRGTSADEAMAALTALIEGRFGEE